MEGSASARNNHPGWAMQGDHKAASSTLPGAVALHGHEGRLAEGAVTTCVAQFARAGKPFRASARLDAKFGLGSLGLVALPVARQR